MEPARYTKQPWEKHQISFDATDALSPGDSVASYTVTIWENTTERTDAMLEGITAEGNIIYATVKAGTDNTDYWLRVRVTTASSQQIEDDLMIRIREIGI